MHLWGVVQGAPWGHAMVWQLRLQLLKKARSRQEQGLKGTGLPSLRWGFVGEEWVATWYSQAL